MPKLLNYCLNITDGEHGSVVDDINGKYYLLSNKNIIDGKIVITKDDRQISRDSFTKINKRTKLSEGDIVISTVGTIGKLALINEQPYYDFQRSVGIIKCDETKLLNRFLLYYFHLPYIQSKLLNISKGAVQKCIFINDLKEFDIEVPDITEQQKIADVLSALDDKIKLNNKINAELEATAKDLYNYWFVQFDFPDENGRPYKSSGGKMVYNPVLKREIPDGWAVERLKLLCDVITGKEDANLATEKGEYAFFTCGDNVLRCDKAAFDGKAILVAGNGNFNVKYYEGKFNAYQRTYVLMPNNKKYFWPIYIGLLKTISKFIKGSNGSIIKFIKKGDIEDVSILLPKNLELLNVFNRCLTHIDRIRKENDSLVNLRDFLLPMLMNGQVSVE